MEDAGALVFEAPVDDIHYGAIIEIGFIIYCVKGKENLIVLMIEK